jgi:hypothetical protein
MFTYDDLADDLEVLETDDGYMVYDHQTDEYLYDENGDNCFDKYFKACQLAEDLIKTRLEHQND